MTNKRAPCPQCDRGPRDTALAVTTDEKGTVSFCHRCGYTTHDNVVRLGALPVLKLTKQLEWSGRAEATWQRGVPLAGTLGQSYLKRRGCVIPPVDGDLRFLAGSDLYPPTLCARITDAESG